jgi:hypothetical protein
MEEPTNFSSEPLPNQIVNVTSPRNKKIGLLLFIGPIVGLIITLMVWGVISSMFNSNSADSATPSMAHNIFNVIFGLIGIICVVGIVVGIPLGIIFLRKKDLVSGLKYDERSGNKAASVVPAEIKGWNWGAAGLTWIWGVYHGVWISLLVFIPLVNIVMWFVLGIKGSEWAWKSQKWESVDAFKIAQKKWKPWGIVFFILGILATLSNLFNN